MDTEAFRDILPLILARLCPAEIKSFCSCNQKFYSYFNDDNFWRLLAKQRWSRSAQTNNRLFYIKEYHNDMELLFSCAADNDVATLIPLLNRGINTDLLDPTTGENALLFASVNGSIDVVEMLLRDDNRALRRACITGEINVVKRLLQAGADINTTTKQGDTPLILATCYRQDYVVELLIRAGADINAINKLGDAAINWAVQRKSYSTIKLLIYFGAEVNVVNNHRCTPLWLACWLCQPLEIITLLLDNGAQINFKAYYRGYTPLHVAIVKENKPLINLLLSRGADPTIKNNYGHNAFQLARLRKNIT